MKHFIWSVGVGAALTMAGCSSDDDSGNTGAGGSGATAGSGGSGAATGGSAGQATGGSAGQATGGSAGQATGGSAGQATGGSAGQATGGSAGQATGGSAGQATGGSAGQATGGSAGQATGGSAGQATGGSAGQGTGGSGGGGAGCVGTAKYNVTFDATWSASTHPTDFPSTAHWSPLTGATHNATASLWKVGGIATAGIEEMAETGATTKLKAEIDAGQNLGSIQNLIAGGGISSSPGQASIDFQIEPTHSLVSLVSMIAPSPDWFIGVHDHDLCGSGGKWLPSSVIDVFPYDAGTDSGVTYFSANADTQPKAPITAITSAPLGNGSTVAKLGTLTFTKK